MDVTPLISANAMVIQGYARGGFRVSSQMHEGAVIVLPHQVVAWDAPTDIADLSIDHFAEILDTDSDVELILLGCGEKMALPPKALKQALRERGVSLEAMDTGAACRTYNVLLADGRQLAAALFPV